MTQIAMDKMKVSLTEAIEKWWETARGEIDMPYIGEDTLGLMALSAAGVLAGVADTQKYLESQGMLDD